MASKNMLIITNYLIAKIYAITENNKIINKVPAQWIQWLRVRQLSHGKWI